MSHHDDDCDNHDHDHGHDGGHGKGPNTDFLDLELDKVMFDEAESIVRESFRELLKEAAKTRIQEVWGERIGELARLAVDEALADNDASFKVQAIIAARNEAKKSLEDKIQKIIHGDDEGGDEGGDANEGEDA